ncbi:MAG: hypothetical protein RL141_912 [Candidatus Parcubacteria bacterium]|jgi:spore coat polysaccharide biosynthesis protein SpsF
MPAASPKVIAIIQARMGSARLPGKVLLRVCGKTLLEHQLERVMRARLLHGIVVATSTEERDTPIAQTAQAAGVQVFRGSERDVLDRYVQAARVAEADVIVRLTADCPLMDPAIVDRVVEAFFTQGTDYVSNVRPPTFPDGMDVEVFTREALEVSGREACLPSEREHVTAFIATHPQQFTIGNVAQSVDQSAIRLTVDEPADWELVRQVFEVLYPQHPLFSLADIIHLLTQKPELITLNSDIVRNAGYLKSLAEDASFRASQAS